MTRARNAAERKPRLLGGSLHRSPDGRLCTIQTTGGAGYPTPLGIQQLWSNVKTRRYPKAWDGLEPEGALVVYWTDPIDFRCERCGRSLGNYVAYEAGDEFGIVEDTARRYYPRQSLSDKPESVRARFEPSRKRFELAGKVGWKAAKTFITFRCATCRHQPPGVNLARIGRGLSRRPRDIFRVGTDPIE